MKLVDLVPAKHITDSDVARTLQLIHGCMGKLLNKTDKLAKAELIRYFSKLKLLDHSPRFTYKVICTPSRLLRAPYNRLGRVLVSGFINILKLLNT